MAYQGNGFSVSAQADPTVRPPQRLVLLQDEGESPIEQVLLQYEGPVISGKRVYHDLVVQASDHPGQTVAAEWLGTLGWTRFLWCRR